MSDEENKHPALRKRVLDTERVQVTNHGGVHKVRLPAKWNGILKTGFFVDMTLFMEDGVPYLEIRRVQP